MNIKLILELMATLVSEKFSNLDSLRNAMNLKGAEETQPKNTILG